MRLLLMTLCLLFLTQQVNASDSLNSAPFQRSLLPSDGEAITVKRYCDFLEAAISPNDFYDAKMSSEIARFGEVGNYHYEFTSTTEPDAPINFLSRNDAECYCRWENAASTSSFSFNCCSVAAAFVDPFLKSNLLTFRLVSSGASAHEVSLTGAAAVGEMSEFFEDIGAAIVFSVGGVVTSRGSEIDPTHSHGINAREFKKKAAILRNCFNYSTIKSRANKKLPILITTSFIFIYEKPPLLFFPLPREHLSFCACSKTRNSHSTRKSHQLRGGSFYSTRL